MIKIYNLRKILKILILLLTLLVIMLVLKKSFFPLETVTTFSEDKVTYKILVDVEESKLFLLENETLIKTYKCSGGKISTPSPIGTWTIISKAKWGEGFGR